MAGPTLPRDHPEPVSDRGVGDLLRRLADDSRTLLRQEVELAKLEVTRSAVALARGSAVMAVGVVLLAIGLVVLLVFVVLALGRLLNGQYWLSTLIVGAFFALTGVILLVRGRRGLRKDGLKPERALAAAQETKEWALAEVDEFKRDLRR